MAGSWQHVVNANGTFIDNDRFPDMIENLGDAYEALEECYGMIVWLTNGDAEQINEANERYQQGLAHGIK